LAKKLSKRGVNVLYYVAPQAWVWKPGRAEVLSKTVHTLFTILPFEKKWFNDRGVSQVKSIPHPLMITYKDKLGDIPAKPFGSWKKDKLKILLLPGSRKFEIQLLLPVFIKTVEILKRIFPIEVHLVRVAHIPDFFYSYYKDSIDIWYASEDLVKAMKACHLCLAASGTVTVSTGLFELPTLVAYRGSLLNEFIYNQFVNYTGFISITNMIHGKSVFPEYIQGQVDAERFARVLKTWIEDEKVYNELKANLRETKHLLSGENFSVPQYMAGVIND
jgi:lipid-A-disaccharide synthase